jgi:hypothetical protein
MVFFAGIRAADISAPDFWATGATILGVSPEEEETRWRQAVPRCLAKLVPSNQFENLQRGHGDNILGISLVDRMTLW